MNNISIGKRIFILMLTSGVLLLAIAGIGWRNESHAVAALKSVYQDRVAPLRDLARIGELLGDNTAELLLVIQHDPKGPLAVAHDHPVDIHLENFNKRRAEIEGGVARVNEGVKLAHQAGDSITGIQTGAGRVAAAVDDIGSALDEQAVASQEIARGVERIASMAEESSASVRQTTAATELLHGLAGELERSVVRFRV